MKLKRTILILIIILGGFLRFYKLDWGQSLFTHPDEYHIVIAVNQLSFPAQMNPHFFSYGTVIIYLIYFTKLAITTINPFLIGRFYSALFSTLTIFVVFKIAKFILEEKYAIISAFLVAITPGLIQQAHFATPESTLTFFIFTALFFLIKFIKQMQLMYLLVSFAFLGFGLGTKIIAGLFFPVIFIALIFKLWRFPIKLISFLSAGLFISLATFFITSPFVLLDYTGWRNNFNYENAVARGDTLVFYTRQFINTYPVLFQLEKILPYSLGIPLLLFSILGITFISIKLLRIFSFELFIIFLTFFCFLIPNSFLFAKWTRFIAPTFPFFAIFAVYSLQQINIKSKTIAFISTITLLISTAIWFSAFFLIYLNHDIRITADKWLRENTPPGSTFFVEEANTVEVPLQGNFKRISANFYDLESNLSEQKKISSMIAKADYFIVESRRIFANHQRLPNLFPKTAGFYNALFSGKLGFKEIKTFTSFPFFSDEQAEETWSVFDHPVIRVFKKI